MSGLLAATPKVKISNNNGFSFGDFMVLGEGIVGEAVVGSETSQSVTYTYPLAIDIRRGRERVLDTYNTGSASVSVVDGGVWNPLFTVYSPTQFQELNPGIQIKITAEYPSTMLTCVPTCSVSTPYIAYTYVPFTSESLDIRLAFVVTHGLEGQYATLASVATTAGQISWIAWVNYGKANLTVSLNGTTTYNFESATLPQFEVGTAVALRIFFDGITGRVSFLYWETSPVLAFDIVKSEVSWTLINTVENATFTAAYTPVQLLHQSTDGLKIAKSINYDSGRFNLLAFCLKTWDIYGTKTTRSSFDMTDGLKTLSASTFTDVQSHTWTNSVATISSVNYTYPLFAGYISSFDWNWTKGVRGQNTVTFNAEDAFRPLNMVEVETVTGANANDLPGARINQVLTEIVYPTSGTSIATGTTPLQDDDGTVRTVLPLLQAIAESDLGAFYADKTGFVEFEDRETIARRLLSPSIGFDDIPNDDEFDYQDFQVAFDDDLIVNDVSIDNGGDVQQVTDPTSIAKYFKRSMSKTGLLMENDIDALSMAQTILNNRKDPLVRITGLGLDVTKASTTQQSRLLASVYGAEFGQPLAVAKNWYQTDPNLIGFNNTSFNDLLTIQGISHTIRPDRWIVEFATSEPITSANILDDTGFGILYY